MEFSTVKLGLVMLIKHAAYGLSLVIYFLSGVITQFILVNKQQLVTDTSITGPFGVLILGAAVITALVTVVVWLYKRVEARENEIRDMYKKQIEEKERELNRYKDRLGG